MVISFLYVILAILGLSFLIFIHELGHFWMARRTGMRVETFAIGFGRPLYVWESNGTKWQIGWLPFGGYVKIAGTDTEKEEDLYNVPGGFFTKSPLDRILVAVMGPMANLVFAFIAFAILWGLGGREKNFMEFTTKIGWVDPNSELYAQGVRPGDEIISYNDKSYQSAKDHIYEPMTASDEIKVKGTKVNYKTGDKIPFEYNVKTYQHPSSLDRGLVTAGILAPANYIIYNKQRGGGDNQLPEGSPLQGSGIEYGDRVLWVDGEMIFSSKELESVLNDGRALLTVQRGGDVILRRVPRVEAQELKLDAGFREELVDWQFEAQLNGTKLQQLYAIPYNLTNECVVENALPFIDKEKQEEVFTQHPFSNLDLPLKAGDKILAVDGAPVEKSYQLLAGLQKKTALVIIQRSPEAIQQISSLSEDADFDKHINAKDLLAIVKSIGTGHPVKQAGNLYLLAPITPKTQSELMLSPEKQAWLTTSLLEKKKEIEKIEDPEKKALALNFLEQQEKLLLLGLPQVQDRTVNYNPMPTEMFRNIFQEISRTLGALLSGHLNPKWLSGPIGIVQVVHDNSMVSIKEALFWLGAISLNLGILNLLPIPVLDGGTILLNLIEMVTRRRIPPKTLEKLILPFAVMLIVFFIFLTYHDLTRILGRVWN